MVGFASAAQYFEPYDPKSQSDVAIYNFINAIETLSFNVFSGADQDFIGINYYQRWRLKAIFHPLKVITDPFQVFSIEWVEDKNPDGLYNLIKKFSHLGIPIIITENGINDQTDTQRAQFILHHLQAISQAIKDGANVIGYMYWSLTDNWEWEGFDSYYGLIEVDRQTMKRTMRPSAYIYAQIIKNHAKQKNNEKNYK